MGELFRTKTEPHKRYYCNAGSRYENVYQEEIDKKSGSTHLVKTGETCVYDLIQADLEQSKIENIIHKLAMGDYSVLREAKLTYVDESDFPKDLMEAQNIVVKAKAEFDKFPADVKREFNNSPEQYVSEMGTDEFIKKMAPFNEEIAKKQKEDSDREFNQRVLDTATFNKAVNAAMGEGDNS